MREASSASSVSPGTELGRYTLGTRLEALPGGERWSARDTTLERDVTLLVMPADAPETLAALDAARRAAGIEAPQLVRILDVGTEGPAAFVAEDPLPGASTYAELIGEHGLPAEEVRRITGEVATGVEAARTRGLHHLALTPDAVLVTTDGRVKVRGMATSAALQGLEDEGDDASREDATGVVALAYAGLTGTWPLPGEPGGLRPAERPGGQLPAPSELAVGVPGDLDTICRETLAEGAGPDSPGDYAAQIAPWSRMPFTRGDAAPTPPPPVAAAAPPGTAGGPTDATVAIPADDATRTIDPDATRAVPAHQPDADAPAGTATGHDEAGLPPSDQRADGEEKDHDATAAPGPDRAAQAAAAAAGVLGAAASGGKVLGERIGSFARTAGERSREAVADRRARREALREDEQRSEPLRAAPSSAEIEPPMPLLPVGSGEPPTREQSRLVLLLMGAFVVLAFVAALIGMSKIGDNTDLGAILGGDETTAITTEPTTQGAAATSESSEETGDEPYAILGAVGYDPAGDGVEHNAEAQRVYDGDPATTWTSEGYQAEGFAGKPGVGVVVDLGQVQEVRSVTLTLPTPANAQVFVGDQPTHQGSQIGESGGRTGEVRLDAQSPVKGQFVTVWFTSTAPSDDGRHRATLGEIVVR